MENAQPEPSMEEILASIRRIISEDEDDQGQSAAKHAPEKAAAKPELTLRPTEGASPSPVQTGPAAPAPSAPAQAAPPQAESRPHAESADFMKKTVAAPMHKEFEEEIIDHTTAAAASQAFRSLSQSVRISEGPGKTLEDIVTEMLRPMVKDWLDANLPAIVEEKVEEEVQRVARRRRG
jgi:hypothetical protein